jgi:prophage regulatory protein
MPTFLRLPALANRLGISIRTVHDRVRTDPYFPKPVKLGSAPQSPLGFVLAEIEAYEARLMAARDPKGFGAGGPAATRAA